MSTLQSLPTWQVLVLSILFWAFIAIGLAFGFDRWIRGENREKAGVTAVAYMTAFGSLFAILTGFLINSEYAVTRQVQSAIGVEVSAASQLASATAALPPSDALRIQTLLENYIVSLSVNEWPALAVNDSGESPAVYNLRALQQEIYLRTGTAYVSSSVASTLQDSINTMTTARRDRIVLGSQTLGIELFGLAVIAGLGLVANALLISNRQGRRFGLVAIAIVSVVALDIGAIAVISAPFKGGLGVSSLPLTQLANEIDEGIYLPWKQ